MQRCVIMICRCPENLILGGNRIIRKLKAMRNIPYLGDIITRKFLASEALMAVGTILTVLSNIPWGKVVETAPKVADAAAKLWDMVSTRRKQDSPQNDQSTAPPDAPLSKLDLLEVRVLTLEDSVKCLQDQMQASSELIKALADQNTQLVQRVELNRVCFVRYGIATALASTTMLAVIIYLLLGW